MKKKPHLLFNLLVFSGLMSLLLGNTQNVYSQKSFVLDGQINGLGDWDGPIYITKFLNRQSYRDSAKIVQGKFQFKGQVTEPTEINLSLTKGGSRDQTGNSVSVFIESGHLTIVLTKDHFDNVKMTGSVTQTENQTLQLQKQTILDALAPYSKAYDKANMAYIAAMKRTKDEDTLQIYKDRATKAKNAIDPYIERLRQIDRTFIKEHPSSYVTAAMMRSSASSMSAIEVQTIYDNMPKYMQVGDYGRQIKAVLDKLKRVSPGAVAYDFSSTDINGRPLSLKDFTKAGKYVLLDFWASWCGPCRKGNPRLKELYQEYKDKGPGLEIIGIASDDSKPEAWKKAVSKDGMGIWKHVLSGYQGYNPGQNKNDSTKPSTDISAQYVVHYLPTKILIDPNGVIIGRYGSGGETGNNDDAAMEQKLKEIFSK